MKKPANLVYGLDDRPPAMITIMSGFQNVAIMAIYLIMPLIVCRAANAPIEVTVTIVSLSFLVMGRASFALHQAVEAVTDHCDMTGPLHIETSFDEFRLDLVISYRGTALDLPDRRPSAEEIRDSRDGLRHLAGFLLRRTSDQVRSEQRGATAILTFNFDH